MEEAFNQLKKEFNSLRVSFTECRTELALNKCKSDEKIAELESQVAALTESNTELLRRVNALSPQKVVSPWEKLDSKSEPLEVKSGNSKSDHVETVAKPESTEQKPKTKNWDAICRDLSDDGEQEVEFCITTTPKETPKPPAPKSPSPKPSAPKDILEKIQQARPNVPQENWDLIECFMNLFRGYLDAMRHRSIQPINRSLDEIGPMSCTAMCEILLEWKSDSTEFLPLAQAVLLEMPRMCEEKELMCWECGCRMFTPLNMFDHLVDDCHFNKMQMVDDLYFIPAMSVQRVLGKLSFLLKRSNLRQRGEVELKEKGEALFRTMKDDPRLRPTGQFTRTKLHEYMNLACAGDEKAIALANITGQLNPEDDEYKMRVVRKCILKNRERFLMEIDEHLSTGVAHCSACQVAYTSRADYYKHVTSYVHAATDRRMFGGYMIRLARGEQDWNITS